MSTNSRIYVVNRTVGGETLRALVRANHPRQAIAHLVEREFTATVATQDDLLNLAGLVKVQDATAPEVIPPVVAAEPPQHHPV